MDLNEREELRQTADKELTGVEEMRPTSVLLYQRERVIAALAAGASMSRAAEAARTNRRRVLRWRLEDPQFDADCRAAEAVAVDELEEILHACAKKASEEAAYQKSLLFTLKCRRPKVWREYQHIEADVRQLEGPVSEEGMAAILRMMAEGPAKDETEGSGEEQDNGDGDPSD